MLIIKKKTPHRLSLSLESGALPFCEGWVICLDVALLTDPDLATSDLHSDQGKAFLQGPSVHDGLDVQLLDKIHDA